MQEGKQNEGINIGLELVSRQFRKRRLALWAACSGPVPSFRARVFCPLRHGPLTGAVQEESQLQEQASKLEDGSAGKQAE